MAIFHETWDFWGSARHFVAGFGSIFVKPMKILSKDTGAGDLWSQQAKGVSLAGLGILRVHPGLIDHQFIEKGLFIKLK